MNLIDKLQEAFKIFPGVGKRTAERFTFFTIKSDIENIENLANLLLDIKEKLHPCKLCGNPTTNEICSICSNKSRDHSIILVVENIEDLYHIESTCHFNGIYHILGGHLSPLENINPENLNIKPLIDRIKSNNVNEIILALNPNTSGEVTSSYLYELLKKYNTKITKPSVGLPYGSNINYLDKYTLIQGITERRELKE
ncbi:recombination protein RecR [candidate division WOR-3 bacterium]|jgi:recombination protein RecR|nr:recombination protein RecR [candidate division WOR-3 bacterium]